MSQAPAVPREPGSRSDHSHKDLKITRIPYRETGRFSSLVLHYLEYHPDLEGLYAWRRDAAGIEAAVKAMDEREWPREALGQALRDTYSGMEPGDAVLKGIDALGANAYAVVTAHQLNLFTGPLYVILKACAAIHAARKWTARFPEREFVPVFWLGGEDHDFEEINHFQLFGRTWTWQNENAGGPAGRMPVDEGLVSLGEELIEAFGAGETAEELSKLFRAAYKPGHTLGQAHARLLHTLFGRFGLLVLNADHAALKSAFSSQLEKELLQRPALHAMAPSLEALQNYHVQATPREINLFWIDEGRRVRLEPDEEGVSAVDAPESWGPEEIRRMVQEAPEQFSPNVITRPVYQQSVIPAVAYIGGGGEIAYWLELKPLFEYYGAFYPVLLLRNSVMWVDRSSGKKLSQVGLESASLFQEEEDLVKDWIAGHTEGELNLDPERTRLNEFYDALVARVESLDKGLKGKVEAERAGQLKSLDKLEARLIRSAKQQHDTEVARIRSLVNKFFPNRGLQERRDNFASIWLRRGSGLIDVLVNELDPLDERFTIVEEIG